MRLAGVGLPDIRRMFPPDGSGAVAGRSAAHRSGCRQQDCGRDAGQVGAQVSEDILRAGDNAVVPHLFSFVYVQVILRDGDDLQAASDPRNRGESIIVQH